MSQVAPVGRVHAGRGSTLKESMTRKVYSSRIPHLIIPVSTHISILHEVHQCGQAIAQLVAHSRFLTSTLGNTNTMRFLYSPIDKKRTRRPRMRMPSRSRSSFSRTMADTVARVGARNAYTSSRLNASAAAPAPVSEKMVQFGDECFAQTLHWH